MMRIIVIIILLNVLIIDSRYLKVEHYNNVTLRSCGWTTHSFETANTACFSWHKTYKQMRAEMEMSSIRGGRDAKWAEFPYTVITMSKTWINELNEYRWSECAGALINSKWIVTAAHCLKNGVAYKAFVGFTNYPTSYRALQNVIDVVLHPRYSYVLSQKIDDYYYDIGLMKLEKEIDFRSDRKQSVCLPNSMFEIEDNGEEYATLTAWGQTDFNQNNYERLKALTIKLNPRQTYFLIITSDSNSSSERTCPGDSGGPLVKNINGRMVLIGILIGSIGEDKAISQNCVEGSVQMLFTSIPNMVTWIVDTIRNKP